ncbi:MAG: hypothetical protein AB1716_13540 [Planctomycetota bacterium]
MRSYHVAVAREGRWYVGRVLERPGVTTQGRTLDELVIMVRDAIETLWSERSVQLELLLTAEAAQPVRRAPRRRRASA